MATENNKEKYVYDYPHPAVTTDCVVFGFDGRDLKVLLIKRGIEPFKGMWAFPGGFMLMQETAEECAIRELKEETGLELKSVKQLGAFSGIHRDPRERVVTIAFYALAAKTVIRGGDDAADACWFAIDDIPQLAFDHDYILRHAMKRIREDIHFEPVGFDLLDEELMEMLKTTLPDDLPVVFISSVTGLGLNELKDVLWRELNSESNKLQDIMSEDTLVHRDKDMLTFAEELDAEHVIDDDENAEYEADDIDDLDDFEYE